MHSISDILNIILESIFMGFGIVIPIFVLAMRSSNLKAIAFKELFILTAVQTVRIAGILYFVLWLVHSWEQYNDPVVTGGMPFKDKLFGPYWPVYLFSPLMKFVLSQLFWIKKIYIKKAALITFALLLAILPAQRVVVFIASLATKDYLPSAWTLSTRDTIVEIALNIVVFIFIIIPILLGSGKLKKVLEK
ncbi:hypothetical protein HYN59_06580 [Flavobacterium album]|uniref:Uncharacterized protein n=1 Tax=Flavobacterium album TaxID=2175091 RepID=A0A2S1QWV0_9FLAO|nr:hypothetical protein [Flavobacterium album]AWH84809.1 hypothetical protein HYN59_06580 [Flavobacterium album]